MTSVFTNYTTIVTTNFTLIPPEPASLVSLSNLVVLSPSNNGDSRFGVDPDSQFSGVKSAVSLTYSFKNNNIGYHY